MMRPAALQVEAPDVSVLKLTRDLSGPAVCQAWRPVILASQALTDRLPEDRQRAILIHELCHIKRADPWVNLAQTLLQVFYFYNPLVWLANTSIRRVREQAVDERVLVCLKGQLQCYSHTLIDIASALTLRTKLGMGLIGVSETKTHLNARIQLMLHRPSPQHAELGITGLATLIILGCILLPMAASGGANAPAGAFAPADAQTSEKLLKDIQSMADQMAAAFNGKQIDSLMSHYAADLIVMAPGEPALVGSEAQRKIHAKTIGEGLQVRSYRLPQQKMVVCVVKWCDWRLKNPVSGMDYVIPGKSLHIWQRQADGSWKIAFDLNNFDITL